MSSAVAAFLHLRATKSATDANAVRPTRHVPADVSGAAKSLAQAVTSSAVATVASRGVDRLVTRVDALAKAVEVLAKRVEKSREGGAKSSAGATPHGGPVGVPHGGGTSHGGGGGFGLTDMVETYLGVKIAGQLGGRALLARALPFVARMLPGAAVLTAAAVGAKYAYDDVTATDAEHAASVKRRADMGMPGDWSPEAAAGWMYRTGKHGVQFYQSGGVGKAVDSATKVARQTWSDLKVGAAASYASVATSMAKAYDVVSQSFDQNRKSLGEWFTKQGQSFDEWLNGVYASLNSVQFLSSLRSVAADWMNKLRGLLAGMLPSWAGGSPAGPANNGGKDYQSPQPGAALGRGPPSQLTATQQVNPKYYSTGGGQQQVTPQSPGSVAPGLSAFGLDGPSRPGMMGGLTQAGRAATNPIDGMSVGGSPGSATGGAGQFVQRGGELPLSFQQQVLPSAVGSGDAPNVAEHQSKVAAIRRMSISDQLRAQLEFAAEKSGVQVGVFSGGQPSTGVMGVDRTGSHRHDNGGAADLNLFEVGPDGERRMLNWNNPADAQKMAEFTKQAVRAGATGVGAGNGYMGGRGDAMHVGGGKAVTWGPGGKPSWLDPSWRAGREDLRGGQKEFQNWLATRKAQDDKPSSVTQDPTQAYRQSFSPFGGVTGGEAAAKSKDAPAAATKSWGTPEARAAAGNQASDAQAYSGSNLYRQGVDVDNAKRKLLGMDPAGRGEGQSQDNPEVDGSYNASGLGYGTQNPKAVQDLLRPGGAMSGDSEDATAARLGPKNGGDVAATRGESSDGVAPEPAVPNTVRPPAPAADDGGDDSVGGGVGSSSSGVNAGRQSLKSIPTLPRDVNLSYVGMGDEV